MDAQNVAEKSAEIMWAKDRASQALGMKLESVGPGRSVLSMTVGPDMLNGLKTCHGGYMFTLADSAFAFACNAYNQFTFAQHCSITFIAPAYEGDRLTATAEETDRTGRNGIYDIAVRRQDGTLVASFRGHSRQVNGQHFEHDDIDTTGA